MAVVEKTLVGNLVGTASVSAELSASSAVSGVLNMAKSTVEKDYEKLINKPCINGVELTGDKSWNELGFPDIPSSLPADGGNADTVNGHRVESDVPSGAEFTDTTYGNATTSASGLMSASDKAKLDGIETGANRISVDSVLSGTSTNPVQNKVIKAELDKKLEDTTVPIAKGGTGAADAAAARTNLGITPANIGAAAASHKQAYTASECVSYSSDNNTIGITPAAVKKAFGLFEPKSHTHTKSQITDFPESLPANGGNADTVDGLHADDFVLSGREQLEVPSGADVPVWIRNNGKRYTVYATVGTDNGYSNVPNNNPNYVWYVYNGNIIWAYVHSERRLYFCDVVNGVFSGWQALFTTQHMPYVTGTFSGITSGQPQTVPLSFTPSLVFYWWGTNSPRMCLPTINGFTAIPDITGTINYAAFR